MRILIDDSMFAELVKGKAITTQANHRQIDSKRFSDEFVDVEIMLADIGYNRMMQIIRVAAGGRPSNQL